MASALEKLRAAKANKGTTQKAKKPTLKVVPKSAPKKVAKSVAKKSAPAPKAKAVQKTAPKKVVAKSVAKKSAGRPVAKKPVPTIKEINKMDVKELNAIHDALPGEIRNWGKLDLAGKRKVMIAGFHAEEDADEEDESGAEDTKKKAKEADEDQDEDSEEDEGGEESDEEDSEDEEEDDTPDSDDEEEDDDVGKELDDDEEEEGATKKSEVKSVRKRKFDPKDLIDITVKELQNLSESQADEEFAKVNAKIDDSATYFRLGGVLSVIKAGNFIGEHESFRAKVEAEFEMKYRKADYLIEIYDNLVASGVKWNDIKEVGWSKMKEISHLITPENVEEWVEKCQTMNRDTLINEVKMMDADDGDDIGSKLSKAGKAESVVSTMSFKVHADQKETITLALEKVKDIDSTYVSGVALEYICQDFLSGSKKVKTRDMTIKQLFQKLVAEAKGKTEEARLQAACTTLLEGPEFEAVFGQKIEDIDFTQ